MYPTLVNYDCCIFIVYFKFYFRPSVVVCSTYNRYRVDLVGEQE